MGGLPPQCVAGGIELADAGKRGRPVRVQGGPRRLVGPGGGGREPAQAAGHLRQNHSHAAVHAKRSPSQDGRRRGSVSISGRWFLDAARHRAGVWSLMRLNTVEKCA